MELMTGLAKVEMVPQEVMPEQAVVVEDSLSSWVVALVMVVDFVVSNGRPVVEDDEDVSYIEFGFAG